MADYKKIREKIFKKRQVRLSNKKSIEILRDLNKGMGSFEKQQRAKEWGSKKDFEKIHIG